jgi:hypothetical protein
MKSKLKHWSVLLLLCLVGVPVIIYLTGNVVVGPYEGEAGMLGLMGHIYSDAITGSAKAWLVLMGPALLVLIWSASAKLRRIVNSNVIAETGN